MIETSPSALNSTYSNKLRLSQTLGGAPLASYGMMPISDTPMTPRSELRMHSKDHIPTYLRLGDRLSLKGPNGAI